MKKSNVIGIDLAKNVLQVCKVSKHGELTVNKAISPGKLKELLEGFNNFDQEKSPRR